MSNGDQILIDENLTFVNISLPLANSMTIKNTCNDRISRKRDPAFDIFGLQNTCQLNVDLHFPGNNSFFLFYF